MILPCRPSVRAYIRASSREPVEIRPASSQDREFVMSVCRAEYPDGDYVEDVWDMWLAAGGTCIIWENGERAGLFNAVVEGAQGWVEGTRIHPDYRRRGLGTAVLKYAEQLTAGAGGSTVRSIISRENMPSLARSEKAGWKRGDLWGWYSLRPGDPVFVEPIDAGAPDAAQYADSWRFYDMPPGFAGAKSLPGCTITIIPARYYPDTALVTVLDGDDLSSLASYLRSMGIGRRQMHGWGSGLHILSRLDPSLFKADFEPVEEYHLMSMDL
ncbi:histone acetyltransferase [Cenarchaeum symbiosum A]|uniref:Histone acetyltransferase n=1 Tax=Cenarchaeum symbiosum (strain A) TaxID=414004 RepID=A0RU21_CENSY|nr:histone acetyltransferase [Cenarchaeum symbiosum A]